jgi:threonine dehydrogenase-like Zn-dependent dehydrogenase
MKALAIFPSARKVRIVEQDKPRIETPTQVLLRTREVGICGTDREICAFEYGEPREGADRLILGHEAIGEVVETGPGVRTLKRGDLAVPLVRRPCGRPDCCPCRAGRPDFCTTGAYRERGIKRADGFMTEWVVDEEKFLVRVPKPLADVAVLVEPLTVAMKAAEQIKVIHARAPFEWRRPRGLVLGAGPVGLLAAMTLVAKDCDTFVYSLEPARSERAALVRSFGASYISGQDASLDTLADVAGRFHVIFEAIGATVAFNAFPALAHNGIFVVTGVPAERPPEPMQASRIMRDMVLRNHVALGTVNAGRDAYEDAIHELAEFMTLFPDAVRRLITQRRPLDQALKMISDRKGIKNVVRMEI